MKRLAFAFTLAIGAIASLSASAQTGWGSAPEKAPVAEKAPAAVTYAEPVGYTWKPNGDRFDFGVVVDFEIMNAEGRVLGGQDKFGEFHMASRARLQEFMLNLTLSLDGAEPGNYVLRYTLHDINGPKTFSFDQPFVIARSAE